MIDFEKLKEEQIKLSKKVIIKDSFEKLDLIAGIDTSYSQDDAIAAIVVCSYETMEVIEKVFARTRAKIPYVSEFLAYREGPAISEAYSMLKSIPDILMFDGNGILHPRRCGLASHMGVLLDAPSIGIAKSLLIGEIKGSIVYVDMEARAESVATREHARPIYVSPGNKISLRTSVEIVKKCMRFPHKLPEPLHLAHKYSKEIMEKNGERN